MPSLLHPKVDGLLFIALNSNRLNSNANEPKSRRKSLSSICDVAPAKHPAHPKNEGQCGTLKFIPFASKLILMTAQQFTQNVSVLPPEAQRQIDDFIAFIGQKYAPATPTQPLPALEDEPCFGMWADHKEMADSTEYVRELRQSEWGETS